MNPCSPNYQEEARGNPSFVEPLWGSNQWQQTDSSPRGQQGVTSSFGQSFGTQVDTQEEEKLPDVDGMLGLVSSMVSAMKKLEEHTTQELEAHATRILELEQTKSRGDEIMEAQAHRIESLEAKVQELETRLKHQQHEQSHRYEANLRRIQQLHLEVPRLREQLVRVDSQVCRVQQEQAQYLHSNFIEDSSDEEELGMIATREAVCVSEEHNSTSNAKEEPSSTDAPELVVTAEEVRETRVAQLNFLTKYLARPGVDKTNADISATVEFIATLKDRIAEDCETPVSEWEAGISCNDCGLYCTHQLRACVNMIHVMPSVSKVKEKEIPALKRTTKRKLQRIWVPRGVFEVKELLRVDTVPEDQCAKSYMPRWKKRRRRTPATNDSCD